ncbi:MAG: HEAT repeat domain-containing protein [Treponema sp.]|jgi:HEAT repeat protein|nr:HEAT repeat domain-containing protein [Treponema sp.]
MKFKSAYFTVIIFLAIPFFIYGAADDAVSEEETAMRDIINYGTDNEILTMIKKLRSDNIEYLDDDLIRLASKTRNQNIILGVFSFFGERSRKGLEESAIAIIAGRENETPQKINAALDYLGTVKEMAALPVIKEIIYSDDSRYDSAAIKSLGKILYSETSQADDGAGATELLIDYYNNRVPNEDNRIAIISAIGSSGGEAASPFLLEIINNSEHGTPLRMTALEAAGKLKDDNSLDSIIAAAAAEEPNIRFAAIGALGNFEGEAVDAAILESFRDTYFKARLAAIRSAKARRLKDAIPYLRYRAEKDETPSVKEEAVLALGAMQDAGANTALLALFNDAKNNDNLRSLCAEELIKNDAGMYTEEVIAKLNEAKAKKQTAFYKGLLKAISLAKTSKVENFTASLFASTDVIEKFYALDITANNRFTSFKNEVERLTKEKNASLSRRAKATLEILG